jgi:hypothetical protein
MFTRQIQEYSVTFGVGIPQKTSDSITEPLPKIYIKRSTAFIWPHLISRSHPLIAPRLEQIAGNVPPNIVRCKQYTVSDSSKLKFLLEEKFDFTISLKT